MTTQQLAEIKARCDAATAGPWTAVPGDSLNAFPMVVKDGKQLICYDVQDDAPTEWPGRDEDAEFVAHARQDIPDLLAKIEQQRQSLNGIAEIIERGRNRPKPSITYTDADQIYQLAKEGQ